MKQQALTRDEWRWRRSWQRRALVAFTAALAAFVGGLLLGLMVLGAYALRTGRL